jgi:hypothetical protein
MIFRDLNPDSLVDDEVARHLAEGAGYDCIFGVTPSQNGLTIYAFGDRFALADEEGYRANRAIIDAGQEEDRQDLLCAQEAPGSDDELDWLSRED